MATIKLLKSGRWNAQIRRKNLENSSATFDHEWQALIWAKEQEKELASECQLTFLDLGLMYCERHLRNRSSFEETIRRVRKISEELPMKASQITRRDMNDYRIKRLKEVSGVTVRDYMQLVNRIYRWGYREMVIEPDHIKNPCENIVIPPPAKPRNYVVSKNELALLMSHLTPTMASIVELAFETAMRRSEILKLRVKDLHLESRTLQIIDAKTGDRICPLTKRAIEILKEAKINTTRNESRLFQVTRSGVTHAVRTARMKAGLSKNVRLHQLRHSRITAVAAQGWNPQQIMLVSGHRDVRSMARYSHLSVKDIIDKIDF
jgi:integrase